MTLNLWIDWKYWFFQTVIQCITNTYIKHFNANTNCNMCWKLLINWQNRPFNDDKHRSCKHQYDNCSMKKWLNILSTNVDQRDAHWCFLIKLKCKYVGVSVGCKQWSLSTYLAIMLNKVDLNIVLLMLIPLLSDKMIDNLTVAR